MPHIIDFRKPETTDEVAFFLQLDRNLLDAAIAAGKWPSSPPRLYLRHQIPKKRALDGQFRVVWEIAHRGIRDAHRAFARRFGDFAHNIEPTFPHPSAYGYVRGRGIKDNAARHAGRKVLLRCDIKDFFTTISSNRLIGRFIQLGIHPSAAEILAAFATIEERLPLGLNASPVLANLVCFALDKKIEHLAQAHNCVYTRYADDSAISGEAVPDYHRLSEIVESEGFRLSHKKMRITKLGQAHFVTGLSVSDPSGPHVPRRFKRRLRQELYYCKKFGIGGHLRRIPAESYQHGINRIDGSVRFAASIETALASALREQWRAALNAESARVSYAPAYNKAGVEAVFLLDEAEFKREGQNYLALACVTTEQIEQIRFATTSILQEHLIDPYSPGRKKKLGTKGLHFADAPEDLRSKYVSFLPFFPFRAYVAFGTLTASDEYGRLYTRLLGSILPRRLKGYDRSRLTLIFEENPRVPVTSLGRLVKEEYRDLEQNNERRPLVCPEVLVRSKQKEPAISLPDMLLGIFCRYFTSNQEANGTNRLRFERLRDKFRHIVNVDTGEIFSRRHPLDANSSSL